MLDGATRREGPTEACRAHFIIWVLSHRVTVFNCAAVRSSSGVGSGPCDDGPWGPDAPAARSCSSSPWWP